MATPVNRGAGHPPAQVGRDDRHRAVNTLAHDIHPKWSSIPSSWIGGRQPSLLG